MQVQPRNIYARLGVDTRTAAALAVNNQPVSFNNLVGALNRHDSLAVLAATIVFCSLTAYYYLLHGAYQVLTAPTPYL